MEVNLGLLIANQPRTLNSNTLIGFVDTLLTSNASEILPNWCRIIPFNTSNVRGGSRISRGGGAGFQKIFENFVDLFF